MAAIRKPQLETLARLAELAAAVAVVVSVVYLAKQVTDNTRLLRSQSHFNALMLGQRPLELMVANESLAGAVLQCDASPERVEPATWERCVNYYFMQVDAWEYMYYANIDGSIPRHFWVGADDYFTSLIRSRPGYVRFWSEMQVAFDEPFRSYAAGRFPRSSPARVNGP